MTKVIDTDVLVVGGGGAALRAAIEAHQVGAQVALAVKGQLGVIGLRGCGATASGTAADRRQFWPIDESGEVLKGAYDDFIQLGLGMGDPNLARIVVEEAPASLRVLKRFGVRYGVGTWISSKQFLGFALYGLVPILASVIRRMDCSIFEHIMITNLLTGDGSCVGALGVDEETGEALVFRAGAVIMATGGASQLFKHNIHPDCITGDGYAAGYKAGAKLINMEFLQIFLGTAFPTINNLANWVWGENARVYNAKNEEFLQKYLPPGASLREAKAQAVTHNPFSTRDTLSRYLNVGLMKEVISGRGTAHDGIYMDLTAPGVHAPAERDMWLRHRGIEWDREPFEIVVYAMCSNGGLLVDQYGETSVKGFYAVGECAGGIYGADRHGGSMMGTSQVLAGRAGRQAARLATGLKRRPLKEGDFERERTQISLTRNARGGLKVEAVKRELKQAAWKYLLAVRNDSGLKLFLEIVKRIKQEHLSNISVEGTKELIKLLELQNLTLVAEMMGTAALMRKESRGGHYREDYPERDDANWLKSIIVENIDGGVTLKTKALHPDWKSREGDMGGEHWG